MAKSKKSSAPPKAAAAKSSTPAPDIPDLSSLLNGASATRAQWRSVVIRVRYLHQEMRAGNYPNATHMKEKFGVTRFATMRDIAAMQDSMHLPIEYDSSRKGYYYTREVPADLPRPRISPGEALSFCLARRALERLRGTGFAQQFIDSLTRITSEVEGDIPFEWDELDRLVSFGNPNREASQTEREVSDRIAHALGHCEEIEIFYWTPRTPGHEFRRVQPLHLRLHGDIVYLMARALDRTDDKVRLFVFSRIAEARLTGEKFEYPRDFDVDEVFRHSIGVYTGDKPERVRLRLSPFLAQWYSERPLHATQQILTSAAPAANKTKKAKGKAKAATKSAPSPVSPDAQVEITVDVAITPELEREILGWGLEIEVLEPVALREKILGTARGILARAGE